MMIVASAKYDNCSSYSLWDTDLNIKLKAIVNIG